MVVAEVFDTDSCLLVDFKLTAMIRKFASYLWIALVVPKMSA